MFPPQQSRPIAAPPLLTTWSSLSAMTARSEEGRVMQLESILRGKKSEPTGRNGLGTFAHGAGGPCTGDATIEFGRFRILPRQRQLLADGVPVELGTRAFDLLMVLIDADGALVTKDELMTLVWPGIFVDATNLKVQVFLLRRALGEDRDFIRTEFGRGYRLTAAIRRIETFAEDPRPMRRKHQSRREACRKRTARRSPHRCTAGSNWPRRATCSSRSG